jgi:hypothetical protein
VTKYKILVGKPEGLRLQGRPRPTWENNIKMYLKGMWDWESVDRINLAQDRDQWPAFVEKIMNFRIP